MIHVDKEDHIITIGVKDGKVISVGWGEIFTMNKTNEQVRKEVKRLLKQAKRMMKKDKSDGH